MRICKRGKGMGTTKIIECACCKQKKKLECSAKEWRWKLDGEYFCSFKCYSKVFDKKYKASSINVSSRLNYIKGRMVDKGYERHGSR